MKSEEFELKMIEKNVITFSNAIRYMEYKIHHADYMPSTNHVFHFVHEDYDGPGDHRCGYGATIEDCIKKINEIYLDSL